MMQWYNECWNKYSIQSILWLLLDINKYQAKTCSLAVSNQAPLLKKVCFWCLKIIIFHPFAFSFCTRRVEENAVWSRDEQQACTTYQGIAGEWSPEPSDSPEHQGSWMQRGNVLYWSISSAFFLFSLNITLLLYSSLLMGSTGNCDNAASWGCWCQWRWEGKTHI